MKSIPFIAICALTFLPTKVEGTLALIYLVFTRILFSERRNERDCQVLLRSAGVNRTESCYCSPSGNSLVVYCDNMNESICMLPTSSRYCTNSSALSYISTERSPLAVFSSPTIRSGTLSTWAAEISFSGGADGRYDGCSVEVRQLGGLFSCGSCVICDNGVGFQYDCSNVDGPKAETCVPLETPSF